MYASRTRGLALVALTAAIALAGCNVFSGRTPNGQNAPGLGGFFDGLFGPAAAPNADAGDEVARLIEEADIIKIIADKAYVLNRYKGLVIIDVADPDDPQIDGMLDLRGRGVEMYVVGNRAYILLSADYFYAPPGGEPGRPVPLLGDGTSTIAPDMPPPDFSGSQIAIIDISDTTAPALLSKLNVVGYADASRRVGDVIYVVGSNILPYYAYEGTDNPPDNEGFVASVNVADPNNVIPVDRQTFSGRGLLLHVSQHALFAASQEYDYGEGQTYTHVQYVDISDPAGQIDLRGTVNVPGYIRNRFYMGDYDGVFRIATETWGFGFRDVKLFTYDLSNPDSITPLGQTDIIRGESLEAVRFDGPRGYVVTFLRVDPLFVLDLSDPANPIVAGHLEVPGYSTHIEPRGNRLIAVGIDDTDGTRPAVAYYDVEDPANPSELGRIVLGPPGSFTDSNATYDEKAFKIVDELGVIAIPFHHVEYSDSPFPMPLIFPPFFAPAGAGDDSPERPDCLNAVQLVDFSDTVLTQRGWFEHRGRVERVGVIGARVFALSQSSFQTVDISDRDEPVMAGHADFFPQNEMYMYDDCGYYGPIFEPPFLPGPLPVLIQIIINGDLCGSVGALPAMGLVGGMALLTIQRRRRRA
ncbi:MAG: beta-propeller domain-containing protein [Phycisphaerae bacterium]|nr:beta-propeller domain-containing protein [Phycisphaerae bacterium]